MKLLTTACGRFWFLTRWALVWALGFACARADVSVLDYGAQPGGQADNTAAFQKALDACGAQGGGTVRVPAGAYRFDGNLKIPANVTLRGTFAFSPSGDLRQMVEGRLGSSLLVYGGRNRPEGPPFIELAGANAAVAGLAFGYPEWDRKTVPPVPYPPTVAVEAYGKGGVDNTAIVDCLFLNSYEAIRLINAGRHLVRNVTGYPIKRGLYIDQIWDVGRVENVHFWPFGVNYLVDDPYCQWINTHGTAFEIGFTDWQVLSGCFAFGYGTTYLFSPSPRAGPALGRGSCGKMVACGADCSNAPVVFDASYSHWLISDSEFVGRWGEKGATAITLNPGAQGRVQFSNCAFWGPLTRIALVRAPKAIFGLSDCQIENWDDALAAVQIDEGRAVLQGNSFDMDGGRQLVIGDKAGPVTAVGNLASPFFDIVVPAGYRGLLQSANSADTLAWDAQKRARYRIDIGAPGDARYLSLWHAQENTGGRTRRWSRADSLVRLPVNDNVAYAVNIFARVPEGALSPEAGVYLGERKLAAIEKHGEQTIAVNIPADLVRGPVLELRVKTAAWRPGPPDPRALGIYADAVEATAQGAQGARAFDANGGAATSP